MRREQGHAHGILHSAGEYEAVSACANTRKSLSAHSCCEEIVDAPQTLAEGLHSGSRDVLTGALVACLGRME